MAEPKSYNTVPGVKIHAEITKPGPKPLLFFIHYYGGTSSTWYKLTSFKSETSLSNFYPTVAIDLRGWGKSTAPKRDVGDDFSVTNMAADVKSVITQMFQDAETKALFNHGFVLVGHSIGAKIALATIHTLPPKIREVFKGFCLVAPSPVTPQVLKEEEKKRQASAYENVDNLRGALGACLANTEKLNCDDIEMIIRDSLGGTDLAKTATLEHGMSEDVTDAIHSVPKDVTIKAVVLIGKDDPVEPEELVLSGIVEFLKSKHVQVSGVTVPDVKHLIPLEAPEAIYDAVREAFP